MLMYFSFFLQVSTIFLGYIIAREDVGNVKINIYRGGARGEFSVVYLYFIGSKFVMFIVSPSLLGFITADNILWDIRRG